MTSSLILRVLLLGYLLLSTVPGRVFAQTLVERLGYPPGTKLLVVHADDLGETHSVNAAAIKGLQDGTINLLVDTMLRVAHEYKLPVFVTRDWFADHPYLQASLGPSDVVLDHTVTIEPEIPPGKWAEFYLTALKNLKPGVTEFVIHPGYDDEELRAATQERSTWGSAWRQRDYDVFTSDQFREVLAQQKIKLITWRELARMAAPKYLSRCF